MDLRATLQSTLGDAYTVERELGGGGMSRVFLAEERALGRQVVVKVLPPDVAAGVNVERFRREIQVSAKLQHPHIVPVLSTGEMQGVPYYTMPFVEGESLRARLGRVGPLTITEAVAVLRDLAKALEYAHGHGVAHRDIKPDNILLSGRSASVADFGIAKAITAARGDAERGGTLTQVGTSLGTPAYMAPEQAAADPATNHRADIYAFGCVAYEVLTGRPPFTGGTPQRLLAAQMAETPQAVAELRPDTPATLAALVMRCLEKEADARPQTAAELVHALETVTSGGGLPAMPGILAGGPGMLRRALALYAGAFVVVAIVARAAILAIGLPDWVFPGSLIVMALGLPVILFTAYVHQVNRRLATMTPTYTPGGTPSVTHGTMATLALKATPHVSWRRTVQGGAWALGAFVLLVGGFMTLRALGIGPAASLFAAGRLSEHDALVVADFNVSGSADSSLGAVVAEAIRTDLGQSRAVNVASTASVRQTLQLMRLAVDARVTAAIARDVAQRQGAKAVVSGDVTPVGAGFFVTVRLLGAETGDELASFRETANGPGDLIPAIETLSRKLREKMGESLRSVRATPSLASVTTPSLEALRKYTEGNAAADVDAVKSIALLREAVAIDTGFAMAWRKLGVQYGNNRYPRELRDSAVAHAFRLRDRLTENERVQVEGYYYGSMLRDHAKEIAMYEEALARGNLGVGHNLALRYWERGDYARAESLFRRVIVNNGGIAVTYMNLVGVLLALGRDSEADSVYATWASRAGASVITRRSQVSLLFSRDQFDSVNAVAAAMQASHDPVERGAGWGIAGYVAASRGQLRAARRALAQLRAIEAAQGLPVSPIEDSVYASWQDASIGGEPARAVRRLDATLARVPLGTLPLDVRNYFTIASVYANAGEPGKARAILAQYDAAVRDTMRRRIDRLQRNAAEGDIALAERRFADAVPLFRRSTRFGDLPITECNACIMADLGRAFDLAGQSDSARAYLEQYVEHHFPGVILTDPAYYAGAYRRLGELHEARGDRERALAHYEKFARIWKDADAPLQGQVADVQRRIARLRSSETR